MDEISNKLAIKLELEIEKYIDSKTKEWEIEFNKTKTSALLELENLINSVKYDINSVKNSVDIIRTLRSDLNAEIIKINSIDKKVNLVKGNATAIESINEKINDIELVTIYNSKFAKKYK